MSAPCEARTGGLGARVLDPPRSAGSLPPQGKPREGGGRAVPSSSQAARARAQGRAKRRATGEGRVAEREGRDAKRLAQAKDRRVRLSGQPAHPLLRHAGPVGSRKEEWFLSRGAVIDASGFVAGWVREGERGYRKVLPPEPAAAAASAASSLAGGSLAVLLEAAEVKQEQLSPPLEDDSPVRKWRKLHQNAPAHRR